MEFRPKCVSPGLVLDRVLFGTPSILYFYYQCAKTFDLKCTYYNRVTLSQIRLSAVLLRTFVLVGTHLSCSNFILKIQEGFCQTYIGAQQLQKYLYLYWQCYQLTKRTFLMTKLRKNAFFDGFRKTQTLTYRMV